MVQQCGFFEENVNRARWGGSWLRRTNTRWRCPLSVLGMGPRVFYIGPGLFLSRRLEQSQTSPISFYGDRGRRERLIDCCRNPMGRDGVLKVALASGSRRRLKRDFRGRMNQSLGLDGGERKVKEGNLGLSLGY